MLFISILFVGVFAVNESLNQTNSSDGVLNVTPDLNIIPDINVSINLTISISEQNLSFPSEQEEQIEENVSTTNKTEEEIIGDEGGISDVIPSINQTIDYTPEITDINNSDIKLFNTKEGGKLVFILKGNKLIKKVVDLDCVNNKKDDQYDDNDCFDEKFTNIVNLDIKNNKIIIINSTRDEPNEMAMISDFLSKLNVRLSDFTMGSSDVKIDLEKLGDDDIIPTLRVNQNGDVYKISKEIEYKELEKHQFDSSLHEGYSSELFTVNTYTVSEIIQKARGLGYVVRIGSMYDSPPFEIYNGTSKKIVYDPKEGDMEMLFNKYINAFDEGFITISISNSDYAFSARPWRGRMTPYTWKMSIRIKKDYASLKNIQKNIEVELKNLGLVDESFNLKYRQLEKVKIK